MSQRLAMIMALALTLVLGTGVYAARGRVIGSQSNQTQQEVVVQATEVVTPDIVTSRQNPPALPTSETSAVEPDESKAESGSGQYAENDDAEHDDDENSVNDSKEREDRDSDHEEGDDD